MLKWWKRDSIAEYVEGDGTGVAGICYRATRQRGVMRYFGLRGARYDSFPKGELSNEF